MIRNKIWFIISNLNLKLKMKVPQQTQPSHIILQQKVNQRYHESLRKYLIHNEITFKELELNNEQQADQKIFKISLSQQILQKTDSLYIPFLYRLYSMRKIINPQINSFEQFLTQYNRELYEKLVRLDIDTKPTKQNNTSNLSNYLAKKQFFHFRNNMIQSLQEKTSEIQGLQIKSIQVNKNYIELIKTLIQRNAELNVQNISLQIKIKQNEHKKKQTIKRSLQPRTIECKTVAKNFQNNPKREELDRIKLIIKNKMWGWDTKIHERLNKLKVLKAQIQSIQQLE